MLFNSFEFVALVIVTFALYYFPPLRRAQVYVLIAASFFFYAYAGPWLLLLLLISIAINTLCSYHVMQTDRLTAKRAWAISGVTLNLLILGFFKYSPLFARALRLNLTNPDSIGHFLITIPLPVGISFFTFQGISLVVDVFRQKPGDPQPIQAKGAWSYLVNTAFFKAFFPQLVAGPIVKAHDFYPQICAKQFRDIPWERAFRALVVGYFLKLVIADNLKDLTYWLSYPQFLGFSTLSLLSMLFGFSMQIFADFAGYSLIAIGTARLFGYELIENFNFPYISQSLSEFWRRWHISLSTWLKEYLYIPLGGNRRGEARTYANLIIVMFLGGLWHGAALSYAIWGLFHGVGLAIERLLTGKAASQPKRFPLLRIAGVFSFVTFAWLLFKLPNFRDVITFVKTCSRNIGQPNDPVLIAYILIYSFPVMAYHFVYWRRQHASAPRAEPHVWWQPLGYAACLAAILLNSGSPGSFIYFQF